MPVAKARLSVRAPLAALLALVVAGTPVQSAEPGFPAAQADYFAPMDDGAALAPNEIRGRNTWLMWTAGNEAFWDLLARGSYGSFDLLKVLDSRNRGTRFTSAGLTNEPGFKAATAPDRYGLWLDAPDGTRDPFYAAAYGESFSKDQFLRIYGRASGVVGLRLFPSPDFDAAARRRWDAQRYYTDPSYYSDPKLVRPYRVGMTCAFCHVGPHPLHPAADPEKPEWRNLSSNIGAQYFRPSGVFSLPGQEANFLHQVIASMPPGTVDTSALASDNINNPRNMNALYQVGARLAIGREEALAGGNLDLPGTQARMQVPHVLKDGADSIGIVGALARVYVSIGAYHQEWLKHFNLVLGGKRQTPFPIATARRNIPYFRATLDRLPDVAAFFVKAANPHPLVRAPGGEKFLQDSSEAVARGQQVFAETCAACHSGKQPDTSIARDTPEWDAWIRTDDFKTKMTALVRDPDFLKDNFLSTDRRIPVSRVGTNACAPLATNALRGRIWDNFSSETYKTLPAAGTISVTNPLSGAETPYTMPAGGRGYQRVPSLVSIWASAPYLHNNSVGVFNNDPSVAGRMAAFADGIEKLLWPQKRLGLASVYRTDRESWLIVPKTALPDILVPLLRLNGFMTPDGQAARLGPIPKGTPVNLLANLRLLEDDGLIARAEHARKLIALLLKVRDAFAALPKNATGEQAAEVFKPLVPDLLALSNCPDFITDRGHLFGTSLPDDDKRALIAFLKRL